MASSSTNFYLTRNGVINSSLRLLNVYGQDQSPSSDDYNLCANFLNMLIKYWQCDGINIISRHTAYLFLTPSENTYTLSNTGDHCTEEYFQTTISSDEASSQTVLSVTSTDDMTIGDYIGIVLDDNTLFWSTIASKTSSTVTIAAAITSAASADNLVFNYTTKIDRPLEVYYAYRRDLSNNNDSQLRLISSFDYDNLYDKTMSGIPSQFSYDPKIDSGQLKIWQTPSDVSWLIGFSYKKMIDDYDSASSTSEFPNEWLLALVYSLAYYIAPIYGKMEEQQMIQAVAEGMYQKVLAFNQENASLYIKTKYDPEN